MRETTWAELCWLSRQLCNQFNHSTTDGGVEPDPDYVWVCTESRRVVLDGTIPAVPSKRLGTDHCNGRWFYHGYCESAVSRVEWNSGSRSALVAERNTEGEWELTPSQPPEDESYRGKYQSLYDGKPVVVGFDEESQTRVWGFFWGGQVHFLKEM